MKSFIILMVGALAAASAMATEKTDGMIVGGGGKAVAITMSGSTRIELLDLWESTTLFGNPLIVPTGDLAADVDAALVRLENDYPFQMMGCSVGGGTTYSNQDCFLAFLRMTASMFLNNDSKVKRLHNISLELTDDSYELALPPNCANDSCVIQIVNYQPNGDIWVDEDSYEKMDELNQAALIVHESIYALLRQYANETNSIRARRAVGYSFAGLSFPVPRLPTMYPTGSYIQCQSIQPNFSFIQDQIFITPDASNNAVFAPNLIGGTPMMGTADGSVTIPNSMFGNVYSIFNDFLTGKCSGSYGWQDEFNEPGPIEFDRVITIIGQCVNGQAPTLSTSQLPPGYQQPLTVQYVCYPPSATLPQ